MKRRKMRNKREARVKIKGQKMVNGSDICERDEKLR